MRTSLIAILIGVLSMNGVCSDDNTDAEQLLIERNNPAGVFDPGSKFSQVVRVRGGELLFISGQVAFDEQGKIKGGGSLREQSIQVFENIKALLASYGADFSNVIRFTIYIVDYKAEDRFILHEVQSQYVDPKHSPASTLLGVQALARPGLLIEIEAIAAIE